MVLKKHHLSRFILETSLNLTTSINLDKYFKFKLSILPFELKNSLHNTFR